MASTIQFFITIGALEGTWNISMEYEKLPGVPDVISENVFVGNPSADFLWLSLVYYSFNFGLL